MKISNLWFFFYQGAASGTIYLYDGRTAAHCSIRAATSGPSAVDNGGYRHNAVAQAVGVQARASLTGARASGYAGAQARGNQEHVACGSVVVAGSSVSAVVIDGRQAFLGQAIGLGSAEHLLTAPEPAVVRTGIVNGQARSAVVLQGVFTHARVGATTVVIGPDEELEEILFLTEVA